jgi:DNA-directed RNA polymerase subunit F
MTSDVMWWSLLVDVLPNLIGTAIGGAIALLLYVYRLNRERKQILRAALFNLLEVWNITRKIVRFDGEKAFDLLFQGFHERFEEVPSPEQPELREQLEQFKPALEAAAKQTILQLVPGDMDELTERYRTSLVRLSAEEPLLAHSLHQENNLEKIEQALESYLDHFSSAVDFDEEVPSTLQSHLSDAVSEKTLDRIESNLRTLAWKAGPILWWKTTKKLNEKTSPEPDFSDEQMSEVMDLMENVMTEMSENGHSSSQPAS